MPDPEPTRGHPCPSCGRPVNPTAGQCAECGARWTLITGPQGGPLARRFRVSRALVYLNVLVWGVLTVMSLQLMGAGDNLLARLPFYLPTPEVNLSFGALYYRHVVEEGQWWRLITCVFLHAGLVHLLLNMYMLRLLGPVTEEIFGPSRFVMLYLGSGVVGSLASLYGHGEEAHSVGASGALMGMIGALAVYGRRRGDVAGLALSRQMLTFAAIALGVGILLTDWKMDNWAHGGGFVGGALVAWPLYGGPQPRGTREKPAERGVAVALLLVVLVSLGAGGWTFSRSLDGLKERGQARLFYIYREQMRGLEGELPGLDAAAKAQWSRQLRRSNPDFVGLAQGREEGAFKELLAAQRGLQVMLAEGRSSDELRRQLNEVRRRLEDCERAGIGDLEGS